jgi:hypothetical protein
MPHRSPLRVLSRHRVVIVNTSTTPRPGARAQRRYLIILRAIPQRPARIVDALNGPAGRAKSSQLGRIVDVRRQLTANVNG